MEALIRKTNYIMCSEISDMSVTLKRDFTYFQGTHLHRRQHVWVPDQTH